MNIFGTEMSRQEIFDKGVAAILAQGEPSAELVFEEYPDEPELNHYEVSCLYRAPNGNKCLIGHLLPDDQYDPRMETVPASTILDQSAIMPGGKFINELQACHDEAAKSEEANVMNTGPVFLDRFRDLADDFAQRHQLSPVVLYA